MLQRRIFFYPYFPSQLRSLIKVDLCERAYLTGIYNSTPLLTYNLAHGGATVSRSVLEPLFGLTHTFHEQIDDIWMRRYAFSSNPADSFPPKHRIFILFFGVVDISLLARRVAQGETDVARGEAVLEAVIEALEEGMRKVYFTTLVVHRFLQILARVYLALHCNSKQVTKLTPNVIESAVYQRRPHIPPHQHSTA